MTKTKDAINPKHKAILAYIQDFKERNNGVSPSQAQIKYRFDITNGTVQGHLRNMETVGLISRIPGMHRAIALTPEGLKALGKL